MGLGLYFFLSFTTSDWHITWVIFPILAALDSLISAIVRNKETVSGYRMFPGKQQVRKSIRKLIGAIGLAVYFLFSFSTGAWYMSWLLFPIIGAVQGLTVAVLDLKEAMEYEA